MKRLNVCCFFGILLSLLCALPGGAESLNTASGDHNTAVLLNRVLHSEYGRGIKPVTVIYVIPYVRPANLPPLKPPKHMPTDKIFLITSADMFYSFWLTPTEVHLEWQAHLVPLSDETALHPYGTVGFLLMKQCKGIPNTVSGGDKHAMGGAFLLDTDSRQPIIIYRRTKGKLVQDGELYF